MPRRDEGEVLLARARQWVRDRIERGGEGGGGGQEDRARQGGALKVNNVQQFVPTAPAEGSGPIYPGRAHSHRNFLLFGILETERET